MCSPVASFLGDTCATDPNTGLNICLCGEELCNREDSDFGGNSLHGNGHGHGGGGTGAGAVLLPQMSGVLILALSVSTLMLPL